MAALCLLFDRSGRLLNAKAQRREVKLMLGDNSEDSCRIGVVRRAPPIGKARHIVASADILDHWHPRLVPVCKSLD